VIAAGDRGVPVSRLILCALLGGCAATTPTLELSRPVDGSEGPSLELGQVRWELAWTGGPDGTAEAGPGSTTNDLGIAFVVEEGWLVDYSLTLVRCADTVAVTPGWLSLLGVGTALAGHEAYEDPSAITPQWGERLTPLQAKRLARLVFEADRYCGAHWLIARGDAGTRADDGTDLSGVSMALQATWSVDGDTGVIALDTDFTQGVVLEFPVGLAASPPRAASVAVVRDAARWFDGVDPRSMSHDAMAWQILTNLVNGASLAVTFDPKAGG
jgi:hypothetical protein